MAVIKVKIKLYETNEGGRKVSIPNMKFSCPVFFEELDSLSAHGYDCRLRFDKFSNPIRPGETVDDVEINFLSEDELFPFLKRGLQFKIWEAGFIGEGIITKVTEN